jgi:hypothetical protein
MLQRQAVGKTRHVLLCFSMFMGPMRYAITVSYRRFFSFRSPSGEAINIENEIVNIDRKKDMKNRKKRNSENPMSFGSTVNRYV